MKKVLFLSFLTLIVLTIWSIVDVPTDYQNSQQKINVNPYVKNIKKTDYDVIVIGGEPEGVASAVSAARNGANVLLIEKSESLGGSFTTSKTNFLTVPKDDEGEIIGGSIFKEWYEMIGETSVYDINTGKKAFLKLIQDEKNITLALNTKVIKGKIEGNDLTGIVIEDENGKRTFRAKRFIDATPKGDLAKMVGISYTEIKLPTLKKESVESAGYMIHLKDVDWEKVKFAFENGLYSEAKIKESVISKLNKLENEYLFSQDGFTLKNMQIGYSPKGEVYIEGLQVNSEFLLNSTSISSTLEKSRKESEAILAFLKEKIDGFQEAKIVSHPDEFIDFEGKPIEADYMLMIEDVWEGSQFWDRIAVGTYETNIQIITKEKSNTTKKEWVRFDVPIRIMIPKGIDGLLVTGKASAYEPLNNEVVTNLPTIMAIAEAGGIVAVESVKSDIGIREMARSSEEHILKIQKKLKKQGNYIKEYEPHPYPYEGDEGYLGIKEMYKRAILPLGYENKAELEEKITEVQFINLLEMIIEENRHTKPSNKDIIISYQKHVTNEAMTTEEMYHLFELLSFEMDENLLSYAEEDTITKRDVYMIMKWLIDQQKESK